MITETEMRAKLREAFNDGIEAAALVAEPPMMHRKGKVGMWRLRRKKIADDIRACKVEFEGA
jgi:hypothetical protein